MIAVREVADPADYDAAIALRREVFVVEQGVTEAEDLDGRDPEATHFVAVDDGRVIAACRVLEGRDGTILFGRLVVAADRRREGVASLMLAQAETWARTHGGRRISLSAQTAAQTLYEQAGYRQRGEPYVEARIEHVWMDKDLA